MLESDRETLSGRCAINRLRTGLAFGALLTVVVAGWLAIFSAPSPASSPLPRSTQKIVPADTSATNTADATRLNDFNNDGLTDLVAVDNIGVLWLYPGYGAGGFQAWSPLDTGWYSFTAIASPGDVTGDGTADVIARDAGGHLWLYPGTGAGGLGALRQIGSGWNAMNLITAAGDMTGDGQPDLLARDTTGKLWLYPWLTTRPSSPDVRSVSCGAATPSWVPATSPATGGPTSWLATRTGSSGSTGATAPVMWRPAPWCQPDGRR